MYTWGYIKGNILSKLDLDETRANELGFLSRFPYYANEAMTQICSAVKPKEDFYEITVTTENSEYTMPNDFISFSQDVPTIKLPTTNMYGVDVDFVPVEAYDDSFEYRGYNKIFCKYKGTYRIPYNARWFMFSANLHDEDIVDVPADIGDAIPSYVASQCLKIDDEIRSAYYRNEYEMFLSRIDNTSFIKQRTFYVGGGW